MTTLVVLECVALVPVFLLAAIIFRAYIRARPWDPYSKDYPLYFLWATPFTGTTIDDEPIQYYLTTTFRKIDALAFKEARMLEDEARDRLLSDFHRHIFVPYFEKRLVFAYGDDTGAPGIYVKALTPEQKSLGRMFSFTLNDGPRHYLFTDELNLDNEPFRAYGCEIITTSVQFELTNNQLSLSSGREPEPSLIDLAERPWGVSE